MTTKDYQKVADLINQRRDEIESDRRMPDGDLDRILRIQRATDLDARLNENRVFAERMAGLFKQDNERFKREDFMCACGLE